MLCFAAGFFWPFHPCKSYVSRAYVQLYSLSPISYLHRVIYCITDYLSPCRVSSPLIPPRQSLLRLGQIIHLFILLHQQHRAHYLQQQNRSQMTPPVISRQIVIPVDSVEASSMPTTRDGVKVLQPMMGGW